MTRRALVLAALAGGIAVAVVACTLNPQPLPPSDFASENNDSDASTTSPDGGGFGQDPSPSVDAAAGSDAARENDGGDAGDGGDGGDASDGG